MRIFGGVEYQIDCNLPFQYNIIFQLYQSFKRLNSTRWGADRHTRSRIFPYKIQFWTTFIWTFFFDAMGIFGSVEPLIESTFPFFYIIIWYLSSPLTPLWVGDRHIHSRTFLYEIQFQTTFIWTFFWCDAYLWQRRATNWIYFSISLHYNNSDMRIFRAP